MELGSTHPETNSDGAHDEYANTPVPESAKTVRPSSIFSVMLGTTTALIWFSLGAQLVQSYGTANFLIGATVAAAIVGVIGFVWVRFASRSGFNSDLITRASGFGYLGSTVTALIFAGNNILFFAFEGGIMINAVHAAAPGIPLLVLQIACGVVFIPLTCFGIGLVSRLMWVTLPVIVVFFALIAFRAVAEGGDPGFWSHGVASTANLSAGSPIVQVMVAMFGVGGIVAVASDFGRFIPARQATRGAVLLGPVFCLVSFVLPLLFGAWLGGSFGENDPAVYFAQAFGILGVFFVVVTQMRINVNNVYSVAVQLATVARRLFNVSLPRAWWVVITCLICVVALTADLYGKAAAVLGVWGIVLIAWISTVFADLLINRALLRLTPSAYLFDKHELRAFNPVGLTALVAALVVALPLTFGVAGPIGATLSSFVAFVVTLVVTPVMALLTRGRYSVHAAFVQPSAPLATDSARLTNV